MIVILSFTACIFDVSAQKKEDDIERKLGNYKKAITYYHNENLSTIIALRLARCYAMTEKNDSTFYYLNYILEKKKKKFKNYNN